MAMWVALLVFLLVFLIASLPLHFSVTLLGGDSSIIKAMITNLVIGFVGALIFIFVPSYAEIIYFIALHLIYKAMFNVGWIKSLLVWVLQGIIAFLLLAAFAFFGVISF